MSQNGNQATTGRKMKLHHRAKLPNEKVRSMRAEYLAYVRSYGWLSRKYHCGESTARDIVKFVTRRNVI